MARTHSSHTASPRRMRSPQRSFARGSSSEDGSQYEMDLDALGLDSTFASTALDGSHEPPVDRVDTSDVEGPDDFTMNMTYWMTADLQPAAVKSRKETHRRGSSPVTSGEVQEQERAEGDHQEQKRAKGDYQHHERAKGDYQHHERATGDPAAAAGASTGASLAPSPAVLVHGTTATPEYSTPASERSMAHEEKVRSFLSALPDTDLNHPPAGSPLRVARQSQSMLQMLRSSPPKAHSLQPSAVEDHDTLQAHSLQSPAFEGQDTPRKPTQQTVIHHPSPTVHGEQEPSPDRVAELQSRLDQQELASRTRITELETILAYTRTELGVARNDNYIHKRNVETKIEELESLQEQLTRLEHSTEQAQRQRNDQKTEQAFAAERIELLHKLTSVQARADSLQLHLARATAEAKAAREDSQARELGDAASKLTSHRQLSRITNLETQLKDAEFSLECAHADVAAKEQLFQTNINLNLSLRVLRSEFEAQRTTLAEVESAHNRRSASDEQLQSELAAKDQLIGQHVAERDSLERQLSTAQGRIAGLELSLTSLRAQLADAHRATGTARAEAERISQDLEDANDRLVDTQAEADRRVADTEKKLAKMKELKTEAERKFKDVKSQNDDLAEGHAAMLQDVRDKAEDAVRKTGALLAQERKEKSRLNTDMERLQHELDDLRANEHTAPFEDDSDTTTTPLPPPKPIDALQEKEIASLKSIIKTQLTELKTQKSAHTSTISSLETSHQASLGTLRSEISSLQTSHQASLNTLRSEISSLQTRLDTQAHDHAAVNTAMDEQLSLLVSKLMKERARTVVGKRDGQWEEVQRSHAGEKELLGRVLMRQWGREECGIAPEDRGRKQLYEYKYPGKER